MAMCVVSTAHDSDLVTYNVSHSRLQHHLDFFHIKISTSIASVFHGQKLNCCRGSFTNLSPMEGRTESEQRIPETTAVESNLGFATSKLP